MDIEFNLVDRCDSTMNYEFDGILGIAPRQFVDSGYGNLGLDSSFLN